MSSFTSYIDTSEEESISSMPDLLPGEIIVSSAKNVACVSSPSGLTCGQLGSLFVTTLKVSFQPHSACTSVKNVNKVLGETELSLSSIHSVFEASGEAMERKKKLTLGSSLTNKVEGIFILCKNFKFFRFCFKFSGVDHVKYSSDHVRMTEDQGRNITNALLHHSKPKRDHLLFSFAHSPDNLDPSSLQTTAWSEVLEQSSASGCKVSWCNESWQMFQSLPQKFVIPEHVTESQLVSLAGVGQGSRPPVWIWGNELGGAIYAQPALAVPATPEVVAMQEEFYKRENIVLIDLDKVLPNQQHMEQSYSDMLQLHCVETAEKMMEMDVKYLSSLETAGWMGLVSAVLRISREVAEAVSGGHAVVLQECEARNTSILVASLAQLLLDQYFRGQDGFESLIQDNWVSLGFTFSRSHALSGEVVSCNPTFLLFLDCVHQISLQFPSVLEFTPKYLINLWDTAFLPIFDTFIFDCEHDRALAKLHLHSAWDWEQQFEDGITSSWENALCGYSINTNPKTKLPNISSSSMLMDMAEIQIVPECQQFLPIRHEVASLEVWLELFHRSVSEFQILSNQKEELEVIRREAENDIVNLMPM